MFNSLNEDFDAKPVGLTPNAENFGAFQPIISLNLPEDEPPLLSTTARKGSLYLIATQNEADGIPNK